MESSALLNLLMSVALPRLERSLRLREVYSSARSRPPLAIRLDGVRFGKAVSDYGLRSLDVHHALVEAARSVMEELGCCCGYVVSDEINVLCLDRVAYGGRIEKLVSISSGVASATASQILGRKLFFDSRIVEFRSDSEVVSYVLYRARVGFNNFVSQLYHRVLGSRRATPKLVEMIEALRAVGIDVLSEPLWRSVGSSIVREVRERSHGRRGWRVAVYEGFQKCVECALSKLSLG